MIKSKQPRDRKSRNIYIFCTWLTVFAVWFTALMFRCVNLALCKCEFASYLTSRERKMAAFSFSSLAGNLLEGRRTCGNRAKPLGKFREVSVRFPRVSAPPPLFSSCLLRDFFFHLFWDVGWLDYMSRLRVAFEKIGYRTHRTTLNHIRFQFGGHDSTLGMRK